MLRPGRPVASAQFEGDDAQQTRHFAAFLGNQNVACLTMMDSIWRCEPAFQLRGMAVAHDVQGQGLGSQLLNFALKQVEQRAIWCNARVRATPFYERFGFTIVSDMFDVADVGPHYKMLRPLHSN